VSKDEEILGDGEWWLVSMTTMVEDHLVYHFMKPSLINVLKALQREQR
jgi:hypothetical protein